MSVSAKCPGCGQGQHERHVEDWDKAPEGVLGGAYCPCQGGCTAPDLSSWLIPAGLDLEAPKPAHMVVMDQRGNYWRVYPKGSVPGADEDVWSMCPTSTENYDSRPVAVYQQVPDGS